MMRHNFTLFISVVTLSYLISFVSSLSSEKMIGSNLAEQKNFKYIVAVLGQTYNNRDTRLLCAGGILSSKHIITAAQCFMDGSGDLRPLNFRVVSGTNNLYESITNRRNVTAIYTPKHDGFLTSHDIAVAELSTDLDLPNNANLSHLDIPLFGESFTSNHGIVAGFGYTTVKTGIHPATGKIFRKSGVTDYKLRYGFVRITPDNWCKDMYFNVTDDQMCGVMISDRLGTPQGICSKDTGAPLVIQNKVIGIASRNYPNCDDTIYGCIYTKVSHYQHFIQEILSGHPTINTTIISVNTSEATVD